MAANTPASRKAKGRLFQQQVAALILNAFRHVLTPRDVMSRSMGAQGSDLIMSARAAQVFPFAPEIKRTEALNLNGAIDQAEGNAAREGLWPIVIHRRNNKPAYATLRLEHFLPLVQAYAEVRGYGKSPEVRIGQTLSGELDTSNPTLL